MSERDNALRVALQEKALSSRPPSGGTRQDHRAPASAEKIAGAEADLGFRLDPFLRRVYTEVSDGGIGPGYGLLPLSGERNLSSVYADFRSHGWPQRLLPAWYSADGT